MEPPMIMLPIGITNSGSVGMTPITTIAMSVEDAPIEIAGRVTAKGRGSLSALFADVCAAIISIIESIRTTRSRLSD